MSPQIHALTTDRSTAQNDDRNSDLTFAEPASDTACAALSATADIYPGLAGDESVFMQRTDAGADVIYLKFADLRGGYRYQRLAAVASGEVTDVRFKHLDRDDKLDVEFTVHSRDPLAPAEAATRSFQIYHKEFAWDTAQLLGVKLNSLYYNDLEMCDFLSEPINEMEFPECAAVEYDESDHAELARDNLEWRVQQLESQLRWMEFDVRSLSQNVRSLESRVRKLEEADSPDDSPSVTIETGTDSGLYGDVEDRVEDLESRMDDVESRVDELEDRGR